MPLLPSYRLAGLFLLAGGAFLLSTSLALILDVALLLVVLVDGVALYREPLPAVERRRPTRIPLDGHGEVEIELRNRSERPLTVQWTDDVELGLRRSGDEVVRGVIRPRSTLVHRYEIEGVERGRRRLGDLHLRLLGPAGLLWRRVRVAREDEVVVQPGLLQLRRTRQLALQSRRELGHRRTRELGEGREFERLREYVRGDDPRRIDWKATAKRARTIVREYDAERSQSVVAAIDAGRMMAERFGGRERLDHALAAALVLADSAATHGDSVGLLVFADTVQLFLPPTRAPLARIANALAGVRAVRVEPDYPAAFAHLARQLRRRSLIVLFSDVIDARASAALIAHVAGSARRHLPLLVAMRNVELEDAARKPVADEPAAFRRAAAEELIQARAAALGAVRRQGVLVADVRPVDTVTETVSRYLEVKQRGRL